MSDAGTRVIARAEMVRATLLVALSACCFGSISPLTLVALEHDVSLPWIQVWRYGTTSVLLALYAAWRPSPAASTVARTTGAAVGTRAVPRTPWYSPRVLLIAGGGQATIATLALLALRWIPAATEAFLFYTFPAWVAVIMAVRGVERIDQNRAVALGLALGGIGIMVGAPTSASLHPIGVTMALSAGIVYALYIPSLAALQREYPALDVTRAIAIGGTVVFALWAAVTGTLFVAFDAVALVASIAQGVLSMGAFLGFLAGLSALGAVRTAITSTIEPFWTSLLGVVLLGQGLGVTTIAGGLCIMTAVLLLQRPPTSPHRLHSS